MAASDRQLGNDWLFRLGGSDFPILCQQSGNLEASADDIDATCKEDTAKYLLAGKPGYNFAVTSELDELNTTSKYTFKQVVDAFTASTTLDFQLGRTAAGNTIFEGTCKVGGWSIDTPLDDVPEWTANFRVLTITASVAT